jgi:hypothetical protein
MEPDAVESANPQWAERPFVLQSSELTLDGAAPAVHRFPALRFVRDQRVETVGLDPL